MLLLVVAFLLLSSFTFGIEVIYRVPSVLQNASMSGRIAFENNLYVDYKCLPFIDTMTELSIQICESLSFNSEDCFIEVERKLQIDFLTWLDQQTLQYSLSIRFMSDLHLEFTNNEQYGKLCDSIKRKTHDRLAEEVMVLSGDIGNPFDDKYSLFLSHLDNLFDKIFILAGNHEYYSHGRSIAETNHHIASLCTHSKHITFLNNRIEYYFGFYFIGTTLWGYLEETDTDTYSINDMIAIKDANKSLFTSLYRENVDFLQEALSTVIDKKKIKNTLGQHNKKNIIVCTHHLPTNILTHLAYQGDSFKPYRGWFGGNLEQYDGILRRYDSEIVLWIYGHTHRKSMHQLYWSGDGGSNSISPVMVLPEQYDTRKCVYTCNPLGYPSEQTYNAFNFSLEFIVARKYEQYLVTEDIQLSDSVLVALNNIDSFTHF